jgi:hypothetical protein
MAFVCRLKLQGDTTGRVAEQEQTGGSRSKPLRRLLHDWMLRIEGILLPQADRGAIDSCDTWVYENKQCRT